MSNAKMNLEAGLRRIKEHGWTKGDYKNEEGYCLVGSLVEDSSLFQKTAQAVYDLCGDAMLVLAETIVEQYPDFDDGFFLSGTTVCFDEVENVVTHWNDASETTKEEVIAIYEKAIASLS